MIKFLISWLPLIGVVVAGSFAILQIRFNNITNSRIKWLDTLRAHVADFNSEIFKLSMNRAVTRHIDELEIQGYKSNRAEKFAEVVDAGLIDQLKVIQYKFDMIRLNLNPHEDLHISLMAVIDSLMELLNQLPTVDYEGQKALIRKMTVHSENTILMARLIFKLEWEKIKRSRISRYYYFRSTRGRKIRTQIISIGSFKTKYR